MGAAASAKIVAFRDNSSTFILIYHTTYRSNKSNEKKPVIVLSFSLTSLTIGSTITAIIFSFSNKDGGHWPLVFCYMELLNVIYSSFLVLAFSIRPINIWLAIIHSIFLTVILLIIENFNFFWTSFLFDKGMMKLRLMIINFTHNEAFLPFIYILFLLSFLLLPKDKSLKPSTPSNSKER